MGSAKKARRKRRLRKLRRISLIVAGVVFIAWIFYLGVTWGPRPVDSTPRRTADLSDQELLEESLRLAQEFNAIASYREPTEQELNLLREAIAKQREFNLIGRPSPENRRRLEELEERLATYVARELHEESLQSEEKAKQLAEAGDIAAAVAQMQNASELQRRINQNFSRSGFRDAARESRLQQQVVSMEAEPLHQRSIELERSGERAATDFQWEKARGYFTEALQLQTRINETARRSAYYNPSRIHQLNHHLAHLRVGEMMSEITRLEEQGRTHEQQGQWESAAQIYERAMVTQNQINRDHPQSAFVSSEKVAELDALRQTALSARQGLELERAVAEMRGALGRGDAAAAGESAENASRLLGQISERFPRSRFADFNLRLEVDYIAMVHPSLPDLQRLLQEDLLPLPDRGEWRMSQAPVSQRTYTRVMAANPSRNRGDDLPVDSVTLSQAREFCRRASWILARPVRLPERADFEAALGEWDRDAYAALSWHSANSGGSSHPISTGAANAHGFYHLVGNLRQWIGGADEHGTILTAGISYADELPEQELFQKLSSDQRAPTIGFRYMVRD